MEETFHIDTVCHSGRPSDPRSAKETACYDLLDSLGIAYERVDHDAAMTMELCHAAEGVLHISICKNLFLCNRQKTKFYLLLMPASRSTRRTCPPSSAARACRSARRRTWSACSA